MENPLSKGTDQHPSYADPTYRNRSQVSVSSGISHYQNDKIKHEFNPEKEIANEHYVQLQAIFQDAEDDGRGGLDLDEFKVALKKTVGNMMTIDEIELLFMKVDANSDGRVDWEEYVTYNLMEYKEKTLMIERLRKKPFPPECKDINSRHRETVIRVAIYPTVLKKASTNQCSLDYYTARYVSLSREGLVTFWNPNMKQIDSFMTHPHIEKVKQPWLTDFVCVYNVSMLAVSSTDRDITIFDTQGNHFRKVYRISGIEDCITCMDYWADIKDLNNSVMIWGDTSGSVYAIVFECALKGSLFGAMGGKKNSFKEISMPEIIRGYYIGVKGYKIGRIHDNWVSGIKFIPEMDIFATCSHSNDTSMYLGEYKYKRKFNSYFKVNRGLLSFGYCPKRNVIATGGMDYIVRVWNPYVNSKPIYILKGHCQPVTHVVINSLRGQIVSIDKGRNIRVFDMKEENCLQQVSGRVIKVGPFPISSICFNPATEKLVLATNTLTMLERNIEEEKSVEIMTHQKPVQGALYNKTFKFVISCCHESVVSMWDLNTGEKVMQFVNAHTRIDRGVEIPIEITAMVFDEPGRRLITGARDGTVKIWNFNNGNCLQQFTTPEALEITGIVTSRQTICVTGWCKVVHYFNVDESTEGRKSWKQRHKDDILCIARMQSYLVATGSYDGDVVVWYRHTGQVYCTLNANKGILPILEKMKKVEPKQEEKKIKTELDTVDSVELADWKGAASNKTISSVKKGLLSKGKKIASKSESVHTESVHTESNVDSLNVDSPKESPVNHPLLSSLENNLENDCSSSKRKEYDDIFKKYEAAVEKILFLETRDTFCKDTAILVTTGAEGWIRFWSLHQDGGLLGQFNAAHRVGESVHALATDEQNKFLFTGDTLGYVKIWEISEYCIAGKSKSARHIRWQWLMDTFNYLRLEWLGCEMPTSFHSCKPTPRDIEMRPPPTITEPNKTMKWPLLVNSYRYLQATPM
jgi:WD40 repeat protein